MSPASLVIRVSVVAVHVGRRPTVLNHAERFTAGHVVPQPSNTTAGASWFFWTSNGPPPGDQDPFSGVSITAEAA